MHLARLSPSLQAPYTMDRVAFFDFRVIMDYGGICRERERYERTRDHQLKRLEGHLKSKANMSVKFINGICVLQTKSCHRVSNIQALKISA